MKTIRNIITISLLAFILASCSKDKQTLTDNTWIVESMKIHVDSMLQYPSNDNFSKQETYILTFENKHNYGLKFNHASCRGKITFKTNYGIHFESGSCSYIGGDSDIAWKFHELLISQINSYKIINNKLLLTGDNGETITLIKHE